MTLQANHLEPLNGNKVISPGKQYIQNRCAAYYQSTIIILMFHLSFKAREFIMLLSFLKFLDTTYKICLGKSN